MLGGYSRSLLEGPTRQRADRASTSRQTCDAPLSSRPSSHGQPPDSSSSMTSWETPSHDNSYTAPELLSIGKYERQQMLFQVKLGLTVMQQQIISIVCAKPGSRWQKTEKE